MRTFFNTIFPIILVVALVVFLGIAVFHEFIPQTCCEELTHDCKLEVEKPPDNGFGLNANSMRIIDHNITGMFSYIKCVDKAIDDYNDKINTK